jgi:hypothetical protein
MRASAGPADTQFEHLYRSSRDDVYAYVATLLRDRFAAEDVTRRTRSLALSWPARRQRTFHALVQLSLI